MFVRHAVYGPLLPKKVWKTSIIRTLVDYRRKADIKHLS